MVKQQRTTESVTQKAHEAVEQAAQQGGTTDRVTEAAHEALDRAAEQSARLEQQLRDASRRASEQTREYSDTVSDYVRENPLAAVGMALAAGFILASVVRS